MPSEFTTVDSFETVCILADPLSVATQGVLSNKPLTISVLGWLEEDTVEIDFPVLEGWYYRMDDTEKWHGPMSYRDANSQARRMTMPKYLSNAITVKYAQVGQVLGVRGGDPKMKPHMRVVYMYANGRQYLGGKIAEFNKSKVPV